LFIYSKVVVNKGGAHCPQYKLASVALTKGNHLFELKYEAFGGPTGVILTMPNSKVVDASTVPLDIKGVADPSLPQGPLAISPGKWGFQAIIARRTL
jgi:hypothetical protein